MTTTDIEVAAVIVNYGTPELTIAAAHSLLESGDRPPYLIVVDNASGDNSLPLLRNALPFAEIIESPVNGGYAGGSNAGIARAQALGAEFIFLFNSDATLVPGALGLLLQKMRADPKAALANPLIVRSDAPDRIWYGGSRYIPWAARVQMTGWKQPLEHALPAGPIPAATGCALLMRTSAVTQVGRYDTSFFGYAEDLELSLRMRAAGWRILFVPESRVVHQDGVTHKRVGGQALRQYLSARNLIRVMRRHLPWYFLPPAALVFLADHVGRFMLVGLRNRDLRGMVGTLRGTMHGLFGGRHSVEPSPADLKRVERFIEEQATSPRGAERVTA